MDRSINIISETIYTNLIAPTNLNNDDFPFEQRDTFVSDECDEKRSYTPQPRQVKMIGGLKQQIGRIAAGPSIAQNTSRSYIGGPGNQLNKSTLSAINHKSEYLSDIGDAVSNYISRTKKHPTLDRQNTDLSNNFDPFEGKSATYDGQDASRIMEPPLTFQELMAKKGSKCICKDQKSQKCGTFCRKQGPAA